MVGKGTFVTNSSSVKRKVLYSNKRSVVLIIIIIIIIINRFIRRPFMLASLGAVCSTITYNKGKVIIENKIRKEVKITN